MKPFLECGKNQCMWESSFGEVYHLFSGSYALFINLSHLLRQCYEPYLLWVYGECTALDAR